MKAIVFVGPAGGLQELPSGRPRRRDTGGRPRIGHRGSDVHGYLGLTGRRRPGTVMGHEAAGEVLEVGPAVSGLGPGDRVALRSILACEACGPCAEGRRNVCERRRGLGMQFDGAYAVRMVVPAALAVRLPDELGFEVAARPPQALHAVGITPRTMARTRGHRGRRPTGPTLRPAGRAPGGGHHGPQPPAAGERSLARTTRSTPGCPIGRPRPETIEGRVRGRVRAVGISAIAQSLVWPDRGSNDGSATPALMDLLRIW
jgi:hypothetical protein